MAETRYTAEKTTSSARPLRFDETLCVGCNLCVDACQIDVMLPIYHGTEEAVLQTSIGHLEPTSLPIGGKSSHCSVSGHRGLPSARLFTSTTSRPQTAAEAGLVP